MERWEKADKKAIAEAVSTEKFKLLTAANEQLIEDAKNKTNKQKQSRAANVIQAHSKAMRRGGKKLIGCPLMNKLKTKLNT